MSVVRSQATPRTAPSADRHLRVRVLAGVLVTVTGDLDRIGAPVLTAAWDEFAASRPPAVRVDLREVEFCDAVGLRALVHVATTCRDLGVALQFDAVGLVARCLPLVGLSAG